MMKRTIYAAFVSAAICSTAALHAAQPADPTPQNDDIPAISDSSREKFEENAERGREAGQVSDREGRLALKAYGECIVRTAPKEAARIMTMDFTSSPYRTGMRMLSDEGRRSCATASIGSGTMRSSGLLFAGEIAEALIETDATPARNLLARAAGAPATRYYSHTDRVAICVVRSVPDQVAALLETERGSAEEAKALQDLTYPMGLCAKAADTKKQLEVNPAGLRAMLATAAFRSIASTKAPA